MAPFSMTEMGFLSRSAISASDNAGQSDKPAVAAASAINFAATSLIGISGILGILGCT
jgi:hypothetical protein